MSYSRKQPGIGGMIRPTPPDSPVARGSGIWVGDGPFCLGQDHPRGKIWAQRTLPRLTMVIPPGIHHGLPSSGNQDPTTASPIFKHYLSRLRIFEDECHEFQYTLACLHLRRSMSKTGVMKSLL